MIIRASVVAEDLSGIKQLSYTVSPSTATPSTGTFGSGQEIKLTATEAREYTVTFTATDNAGNVATTTATATTKNKITVAEAKANINSSNIADYIGLEVEYKSKVDGTWRVFYYDGNDGKFGEKNTVYLAMDPKFLRKVYPDDYTPKEGEAILKRMNPVWSKNEIHVFDATNTNCKRLLWCCEPEIWSDFKTQDSSFAIGSPSIEMFIESHNIIANTLSGVPVIEYKYEDSENNSGYGRLVFREAGNTSYSTDFSFKSPVLGKYAWIDPTKMSSCVYDGGFTGVCVSFMESTEKIRIFTRSTGVWIDDLDWPIVPLDI